jgi:DNA-binding response OmpR family regulator
LGRILVVDDDEGIRQLLGSFVRKQGYEPICASTGEEALEKMDTKPSLVLLDVVMPDLHGLQTLNRIREISPATPVIMVTGMAEHAVGLESLNRGAAGFVTKPIDLEHLGFLIDFYILRHDIEATA